MSTIVVRGDVERICLSADPTCTGVNPCRLCWEFVRDTVMPTAMRAANCAATEGQAKAFVREHFIGWMRVIGALQVDSPQVFASIMQARNGSLAQEFQDAPKLQVQPPLTPFHAIVMQMNAQAAPQPQVQASTPSPMMRTPSQTNMTPIQNDLDDAPMQRGDTKNVVKTGARKKRKDDFTPSQDISEQVALPPADLNGIHSDLDSGEEEDNVHDA